MRALALGLALLATPALAADWQAVDGDTLKKGSYRVRIYGIDTPETHQHRCPQERLLGLQAKDFLTKKLAEGPVKVTTVKRKTRDGRIVVNKDKYGRTLARVYVGQLNLAEELTRRGLAKPYFGGAKVSWCAP
jgi:endonuclease YncB( thermonuclease family)